MRRKTLREEINSTLIFPFLKENGFSKNYFEYAVLPGLNADGAVYYWGKASNELLIVKPKQDIYDNKNSEQFSLLFLDSTQVSSYGTHFAIPLKKEEGFEFFSMERLQYSSNPDVIEKHFPNKQVVEIIDYRVNDYSAIDFNFSNMSNSISIKFTVSNKFENIILDAEGAIVSIIKSYDMENDINEFIDKMYKQFKGLFYHLKICFKYLQIKIVDRHEVLIHNDMIEHYIYNRCGIKYTLYNTSKWNVSDENSELAINENRYSFNTCGNINQLEADKTSPSELFAVCTPTIEKMKRILSW